jgi:hypothetical protein
MKTPVPGPVFHEYLLGGPDPTANLAPYEWIIGRTAYAGGVGAIVGPPEASKSLFVLLRAISIATRRSLTGEPVHKTGKVYIYNAEDTLATMLKRIRAICMKYEINPDDVYPNLILSSGQEHPFILAYIDGRAVVIAQALGDLASRLKERGVVYAAFDPLIELQEGVNENDNAEIKKVIAALRDLARETGAAVEFVHHTPKTGNKAFGDMMAARGGGAIAGAVRWMLTVMRVERGDKFESVVVKKPFIRVDVAKSNMAKRSDPTYFDITGVAIGNGDEIGVHALITDPLFGWVETKEKADQRQRNKLFATIVQTMGAKDQVALAEILGAIEKAFELKNRATRELVNNALPVNAPVTVTLDDTVWELIRCQEAENRPSVIKRRQVKDEDGTLRMPPEESGVDEALK